MADKTSPATSVDVSSKSKPGSLVEIAIERGYCTAEQITRTLNEEASAIGASGKNLSSLLVKKGILTQQQARACERATNGATVIGGFEILEQVGRGGMGAVFRARQISMDRIVAFKILDPKLSEDPNFKQRFLNEARVCANLSHINIINGIDCGEAGNYTYFAMEFVNGRTLKQILKEKGKFSPTEAFAIIRQIADALVYARRQGLVHRDIKPDNIMLNEQGVAKLCDLGLAKHIEKNLDPHLTQAGQALGTPHYISPEQARGAPVDFQSDIYSLGATFYHLLSGKTPFTGATGVAIMASHLADETANPCDLESGISIGYGQIISKMMAKLPGDRYATPEELIDDLEAVKIQKIPKAASFHARSTCLMPLSQPGVTSAPSSGLSSRERAVSSARYRPVARRPLLQVAWLSLVVMIAMGVGFYISRQDVSIRLADKQSPDSYSMAKPAVHGKPSLALKEAVSTEVDVHPDVRVLPLLGDTVKNPEPMAVKNIVNAVPAKIEVNVEPKIEVVTNSSTPPPPMHSDPATLVVENVVGPAETKIVHPEETKINLISQDALDAVYVQFLGELIKRKKKNDLQMIESELRAIAQTANYLSNGTDIAAELADLSGAINFERDALKSLSDRGGEVEVIESTLKLPVNLGSNKLKIVSFDLRNRLIVRIPGGEIPIWASNIALDEILKSQSDSAVLPKIQYLAARGQIERAEKLQFELPKNERKRWERKLIFMNIADQDGRALVAYNNLEQLVSSKKWDVFLTKADEFGNEFAKTKCVQEHLDQLIEWTKTARQSVEKIKDQARIKPGLTGAYYDMHKSTKTFLKNFPVNIQNSPTMKRVDKQINFECVDKSFAGTNLCENLYVLWSGVIKIPKKSQYTFYLDSDDGSRLFLDQKMIMDHGGLHRMMEKKVTIPLDAGEYEICIEFFNGPGDGGCKLLWDMDGNKVPVPEEVLFHKAGK